MPDALRIYRTSGEAAGLAVGRYIYNCEGVAVGQQRQVGDEVRVYNLDGDYVGELIDGMVVDHRYSHANTSARRHGPRDVTCGPAREPRAGYEDLWHLLQPLAD
ncbi:MAG TPA: hypothetical protein VND96_01725 [Candidatus Micrarchaeaceae archaeon]|nr:hypothetical protein [Candidatus Micrarchaeaceae archaeon]